ncbi:MAG: hypothetical protein H6Q21_2172, partial [Bacteroidetes bacterium]|nr:hypothetical protein [Bacteroidota bacterium]
CMFDENKSSNKRVNIIAAKGCFMLFPGRKSGLGF